MPLKKIPASTAHGPPSPTPLDDHSEPSPSIGEPTVAEYNDLVIAHRKALRRIKELEANADSSHTNIPDSHPHGQKRPAPKGPISQQEKSCRIAEGLCLYAENLVTFTSIVPRNPSLNPSRQLVTTRPRLLLSSNLFRKTPSPKPLRGK